MPAQWTAELIGEMHLRKITSTQLAGALGYHPKYISAVLNGHREPKGAEQKFRDALQMLIANVEMISRG